MSIRAALALATCLTASLVTPASARDLAGVTLPEQTTVEASTLVLNGMGLREATWMKIKVYVAGLYVETKSSDTETILNSEFPKRLVFVFVRSVGRKRMIAEWDESLQANLGEDFPALEERVAMLYTWMPDEVRKGDTMVLTHFPGKGVVVEMKGEAQGTIPGTDFAHALFGTWLGASPPNEALKSGLLGW